MEEDLCITAGAKLNTGLLEGIFECRIIVKFAIVNERISTIWRLEWLLVLLRRINDPQLMVSKVSGALWKWNGEGICGIWASVLNPVQHPVERLLGGVGR